MSIIFYRLGVWASQRRKALVALVVPVVVTVAASYGLELTEPQIMALVALFSAGAVYSVPNREQG